MWIFCVRWYVASPRRSCRRKLVLCAGFAFSNAPIPSLPVSRQNPTTKARGAPTLKEAMS